MKRVAAYCRVSTDNEDQSNSLENQKKYFKEFIERNPLWELVEIYVDEGISGTSTKKRFNFNRMINDAYNKTIDLIITKEISRFARNTLDSIYYTRKLKEIGIGVIFMNDNINTLDADSELRLTIMSSIAQEESRKISERVKWGQRRSMEQGVVFGRDMIGYDVSEGGIIINEKGAEIVRQIFHKYTNEGKGTYTIAKELTEQGIEPSSYIKSWSNVVILRILKNEKYCGDLVQKKTYTPNYLDHEKKYNKGEEDFVVIRNHHEPIVSREMFERTQDKIKERSLSLEPKSKYTNRYCFSGKIKCGVCGNSYVSRTKKSKGDKIYRYWRCYELTKNGKLHMNEQGVRMGCYNRSIKDEELKELIQNIFKTIILDKDCLIEDIYQSIVRTINNNEYNNYIKQLERKILSISQKKQSVINLYLDNKISQNDFSAIIVKYESEIKHLQNEYELLKKNEQKSLNDLHLERIKKYMESLTTGVEWDDTFYRNMIDKIVISEKGEIELQLNMYPNIITIFPETIK